MCAGGGEKRARQDGGIDEVSQHKPPGMSNEQVRRAKKQVPGHASRASCVLTMVRCST